MSSYTSGGRPYGRQPHHTKNERLFLLPFCIPHTAAAGECRCGGDAARSSLKCCRVYQRTFQLHRRFLFCIGRTYAPTPKLMSSEISTYLTGRYVSIPVYPLSFREYLFFFRTNSGFPTKIAKQTAAIACPTTLLAIITYQKSFHFFKPVLLQIGRIYAIIKVQ